VVIAPPPTVGSSNPVSPEPLVTRPSTTPCKVTLMTNQAFSVYNNIDFSYTPPSSCPGPWAKVVFSADFTVSAGVQYDRSSAFYLGNATLFRGTTAEPNSALSPSWHVENDVTGLSALLGTAQPGIASIYNVVNSTYTGIIYANAELDFYPVGPGVLAATVPDEVLPLVSDTTNPVQYITSAQPLSVSVTLPKNTTQLYLDVYSQHGGGAEEFWYLSTPNATAGPYIDNQIQTALREADVTIDGTPAGVAPDRPYVFTGGVDPLLWEPIPGAQTLNFKPYRINLTPFAGALSDGNPHTIAIDDINTVLSGGYDALNADLMVYTDHGAATTGGSVVTNTLTANPGTSVTSNVNLDSSGNGTAEVDESLARTFTISGYTNTSTGKVTTTVTQTVNFANSQQLTNSATQNVVTENLTSTVDSTETTATASGTTTTTYHTENPLQAFINFVVNSDGSSNQLSTFELKDVDNQAGPGTFTSAASEDVTSTDNLALNSSYSITGNSGQASTGTYTSTDSDGNNYASTLTAANNVLIGATTHSTSSDSTLFLTISTTTANQGDPVTIVAKIMPNNSTLTPTGYVTFYENGRVFSVIGTSTGQATVTSVTLPAGTDVITASYTGDTNFLAQESINSVTVTITPTTGSFTIGPFNPATATVSQGQTAVVSLPATGNLIFNGTIAFACSGAPSGATCQVNPGTVSLNTSTETSTVSVVVSTTAPTTTISRLHLPGAPPSVAPVMFKSLGGISVAGLCLLLLPTRRGKRWNALNLLALLVVGLGSMAMLGGCGGNAPAPVTTSTAGGTPAGNYTITVTGTSGTISQKATFTLTVN